MTQLSISVRAQPAGNGSCTVVSVAGEADITTGQLGDVLTEEAARKPRLLLVEMTALQFLDSSALRMIMQAHQRLQEEDGGVLALVHPVQPVARVLQLTGIDQMITVYDNVDEAIESFCQRQSPRIGR
jgi:anti-sigma B factor antagonist